MSRITIINGHPGRLSISRQIAESYAQAATGSAHEVRIIHLCDLQFDPDHGEGGYSQLKALLYRSALFVQLRRQIFGFVGIKPARITHFNTASHPQVSQVERWLQRAANLGAAGK